MSLMRRKLGYPTFPNVYFKDGVLSVPGYTFEKASPWHDTGGMTTLAEGNSLKDGSSVLAKIAPAQSNGSMCLEREAHILGKLTADVEKNNTSLRMLDYFKIPHEHGDSVVLLVAHPGPNLLGRYLPADKVNDLLLVEPMRSRSTLPDPDALMGEGDGAEEMYGNDIMDLASFLEFAIQATHCLEVLHKSGIIHREVRGNAFHLNAHTGSVRFVHFGNRAISLENYGSPSSLVIQTYEESEKLKVKEALCYLAPEQTGSIETMTQDHRTDIYSLGILFWTLLVGRGQMPFEGGPLELLHSIVQKRPMPVHEVRRDIPQVLANIVDKMLAKSPDMRYQSAHGLKTDLMQCQARLLATILSPGEQQHELISLFEIALEDRFIEFTIPIALYGRENELEIIRNVIRNASTTFSRYFLSLQGTGYDGTVWDAGTSTYDDNSDSLSSMTTEGSINAQSSLSLSGDDLRHSALRNRSRNSKTRVVLVVGPPGIGKSSIILANQAKWRSHGLWGQAKFQNADSAPFAALLSCLSSVLRQLMVFHTDLQRFVCNLKERLGPQMSIIPLLYQGTPELRDVLAHADITIEPPKDRLSTRELRARFQSLVEHVFAVIAETRLFALFLDDLHEADESTLDLVSTLVNSKSRMLIFITLRSDKAEIVDRIRDMFNHNTRHTWIDVEPLNYSAVASLVSETLHRTRDECAPLSRFITTASSGNAFSIRNILTTLQRQRHITFDWEQNYWVYDMDAIEQSMINHRISDPTDLTFLREHMRELPDEARKYLTWAVFFGETFKVTEVALMIDWEDHNEDEVDHKWNLHKAVNHLRDNAASVTRSSMRGLQLALSEGWLIQRARDMCSFAHDRYRQAAQAEAESLPQETISKMSFRIILMMLHETPVDMYRIAEHAKRCLPMLHEHMQRDELLDVLINAGESAWARGAHELAIQSFTSARMLLRNNPWKEDPTRTFSVLYHLSALYQWQAKLDISDKIIAECLEHIEQAEDKCSILRIRSRNQWLRGNFLQAFNDTMLGLKLLGVELNATPTDKETDIMFEQVKHEILAIGFDEILSIPHASDPKIELAIVLLNDAGLNAYWSPTPLALMDLIGLTCVQLALRYGMSAGTALGFFWALGAAAERRGLYRFAVDLGRLALRIADKYGTMAEKCRAQVLFCALVSGFDQAHLKSNIPRLEDAIQYGDTAGDRLYTSFAIIHSITTRLYVCDHVSDLIVLAEDCDTDVNMWLPQGEAVIFATAILNCIRVYGGYTRGTTAATLFDIDEFVEEKYVNQIHEKSGNVALALNWYNSFKVASFFCVGYIDEAAELGFQVYESRHHHPNHRHSRYALFFHSLALIACVRKGVPFELRARYLNQIKLNQTYLKTWLSPSPVNTSTWIALVDAEVSSFLGNPNAFRLYDLAIKLAQEHEWLLEEGWGLFLQGSHYARCGIPGLSQELQRRGIARQTQWGAQGIVNYMTRVVGTKPQQLLKKSLFTADIGIQTESFVSEPGNAYVETNSKVELHEDQESSLGASDLAAILKWSKDISSDINLSSALQRLTEIATETSKSQNTCVVIAREAGDYTVATSMIPPGVCQVHEHSRSIRTITDPLQKAIIQHALNTKERIHYDDASADSRFSSEAGQTVHKAVLCLPIFGNRGQTFGAVYFASKHPFSKNTVTILTLLCQQASISIANALLFRSVQAGTRENLKMIAAQREALEDARRSREDALKATKIKSNFLASMSHELRTPFSSFYGLLDLLSGTDLNPGQSEIVQTAKQSCELLLKIIDSILDYSKLEASAVKLEPSGFLVENIIADCMELLLPMAAKKLDLSFNIEPNVPEWVYADYARIRQVLMNLIGNAVKFTASGYVRVNCSVEEAAEPQDGTIILKFDIFDTGIGLSASDVELLFVPFQQADNSSTRRFGGTGLGLSISRQLVKLMGGAIGVYSELNAGSQFWFNMPVKLYTSEDTRLATEEIQQLKANLNRTRVLEIIIYSPSEATINFLTTILSSFNVLSTTSMVAVKGYLNGRVATCTPLDFIVLDEQTEGNAEQLDQEFRHLDRTLFKETKVIHLYTPTISRTGQPVFPAIKHPDIFKMTKPPRKSRMLQVLAELKNLPNKLSTSSTELSKAIDNVATAQRTLFGNVLIAEDNPIAQNLLVKQLERCDLKVVATSNGEEAIEEWEKRGPGYFSIAMFDHHMPVCDGVEAAKRLRMLENKRKCPLLLPIVALSADCQEATKQLCLSAGMNAFFSKPLRKNDLMAILTMFGHTT